MATIHKSFNHTTIEKFKTIFPDKYQEWAFMSEWLSIGIKCQSCGNILDDYANKFIVESDTWALPLVVGLKAEDNKLFCYIPCELTFCNYDNLIYNLPNFRSELLSVGISIDDKGIGEYVVPYTHWDNNCKELSRIYRQYKKAINIFDTYFGLCKRETILEYESCLFPEYKSYWFTKNEVKTISAEENWLWNSSYNDNLLVSLISDKDKTPLGIAYFTITQHNGNNQLQWIISRRNTEEVYNKYALGNVLLMKALEFCNLNKIDLNLGISWLEYKKIWKPYEQFRKGLRLTSDNLLLDLLDKE